MNELDINYKKVSRTGKIIGIIAGIYIAGNGIPKIVTEVMAGSYGVSFFFGLAGFILGTIIILMHTLWLPASLLKIDSTSITSALPKQTKTIIDWTSVSRVNIGTSYIVFLLNGEKKQKNIDISALTYGDMKNVKSKIVELCEYKNIPYQND